MPDDSQLYCTFRLAGRWFAVPVLDVKEITTETRATSIPHAPVDVHGLVNIRGHIYLALHLAKLLGVRNHRYAIDSQLILFKPTVGNAFGILVDQVGEILSLAPSQIEPFSNNERLDIDPDDRGGIVSSIGKLEGRLLIILDPRRMLPCVEQAFTAHLDSATLHTDSFPFPCSP